MNESLLSQIDARKPHVTHTTGAKIKELDNLYYACLLLNPCFGELEIDDNATSVEVYDILTSFLSRNEVAVQHKTSNIGPVVRFEYEFPFRAIFVDITTFYSIRSIDPNLYETLLRCMVTISRFTYNCLFTLDMVEDWAESSMYEEEMDQEEISATLAMIKGQKGLYDDFHKFFGEDNISILTQNISEQGASWSQSLHKLVDTVLSNVSDWERFAQEDSCDCDEISFLEYTGFKFSEEFTFYEDWHHSHLQSYFENGSISGCYVFQDDQVRDLYGLKKRCQKLYHSVDLVEVVMKEVQSA